MAKIAKLANVAKNAKIAEWANWPEGCATPNLNPLLGLFKELSFIHETRCWKLIGVRQIKKIEVEREHGEYCALPYQLTSDIQNRFQTMGLSFPAAL